MVCRMPRLGKVALIFLRRPSQILTARPERAVLALAELCIEREDELARAPRSASPAPRAMASGGRGAGPGWRSQMAGGPLDRLSPTLNGLLGDSEEFGRRSYSHMGRRGRQSEPGGEARQMSAQEMWLANQNFGLDGPYAQFPRNGMHDQATRGRDQGVARGLDASQVNAGLNAHRDHVQPMDRVPASAPISPVRQASQVYDSRGYSGTWSTGVSPRQAQASRLPNVAGPSSRRPSGHGGRSPPMNGYGFQQQAQQPPARYPQYGGSSSGGGGRRAFSAGPAHHGAFPPTTQFGTTDPPLPPPPGSLSPLPAFQPFSTSPIGSGMLQAAGAHATPHFISPSALLSPEPSSGLELEVGKVDPFPAYQSRDDDHDNNDDDELTAGVAALGLEPGSPSEKKK